MPDLDETELVLHYYHRAMTKEISSPDDQTENKLRNFYKSMPVY